MACTNSESDMTSLSAPSSPPSPKRPPYFVQSPSRSQSHSNFDNDKSSYIHTTPIYSDSTSTAGCHSRDSSATRFSFIRKAKHRHHRKSWSHRSLIADNNHPYDGDDDRGLPCPCQIALAVVVAFVVVFSVVCLIIWAASRHYKLEVVVKSLSVSSFYSGQGSDRTGVPTKLVSMNSSVTLGIYNPASTFGIHVTSSPVELVYSEVTIATGQLQRHYQARKSGGTVSMVVRGEDIPLYGAGTGFALSSAGGAVPLTLRFVIYSRGEVVGKMVTVEHRRSVSCMLEVDATNVKPVRFLQNYCIYYSR